MQQSAKAGPDLHPRVSEDVEVGDDRESGAVTQMLMVAGIAFAVRLLFGLAISNTYDFDEFVILLLGRDFGHGSVPYRDFMFFHPPMILLIFRVLHPVTTVWWPLARVFMAGIDASTASLVWMIGSRINGARTGRVAALLYILHPLALVSAVRVGQDPLVTLCVTTAVAILVAGKHSLRGLAAGALFGVAVMTKLPALLFAPTLVLAAPRQAVRTLLGFTVVALLCLAPFHNEWRQLYFDTVTFQRTRWTMNWPQRLETPLIFWVLANPLVVFGLFRRPRRWWLVSGWLLGAVFLLTPQVYYHYYAPFVPFACLLSAPVISALSRKGYRVFVLCLCVLIVSWAGWLNVGGPSPLYVTSAHLSDLSPSLTYIKEHSRPNDKILADRFEYAYLSDRRPLVHYFWNIGVLVNASYLENHLQKTRLVVRSVGASSGYPQGFEDYLQRNAQTHRDSTDTIWMLDGRR